jgi:hypothetical protein
MEMVGQAGGTPYISFKDNTTAAGGGLFAKMFHLYNLNRDEFLRHYHKRSKVETTNAMIKAKFGDSSGARRIRRWSMRRSQKSYAIIFAHSSNLTTNSGSTRRPRQGRCGAQE